MDSKVCLGHSERCSRVNKIRKMLDSPQQTPDENLRILIKKGPNKENTSLKELDENYASKKEWKVIEGGGVLSIPMEELRMINPPRPDALGNVRFVEKRGKGAKNQIEGYPEQLQQGEGQPLLQPSFSLPPPHHASNAAPRTWHPTLDPPARPRRFCHLELS